MDSEPSIYWANPEPDLYMYESLTVNILAAIKSSYEIWVDGGGWVGGPESAAFRSDATYYTELSL